MSYVVTSRGVASGWHGFGDAQLAARGVQIGAGSAAPVITGIIAAHAASTAAATGSAATILGMAPTLAVPIIGAAIVGAATAIAYFIKNSGCGPTCVQTSQWANQAEPYLKQNADAYFAQPAPRTRSQQQAALNTFDTVWARLQQLCGQPDVGNAGVRCISDRQQGACKWRATGTPPWPGSPAVGECWNWFNAYRDPIAHDAVVEDASLLDEAGLSLSLPGEPGGVGLLPLALVAGLIIAGVML